MFDFWENELSEEEADALIDKLAGEICRRGLSSPALMFFESHKPLAFLGSQAGVVASPFLIPILGFDKVNDYTRLFAKRENVEKLVERIETRAQETRDSGERPPDGDSPTEDECES
jgi:hypothetical protein